MKKIFQMLLMLILAVLFITGCTSIIRKALVSSGEYEHIDLSETQSAPDIEQKAKEILENPKNIGDFRNAAKLFGSIGELDKMDEAAGKYLDKNPGQSAVLLLRDCAEIRKWYEKAKENKNKNENKKKGG